MSEYKTILDKILDETVDDLRRSMDQKELKASGKASRSLKKKVETSGSVTKGTIQGAIQWYFLERGRGPNRKQTPGQAKYLGILLKDWVKAKGIDINPFAAAWKIVREGIKVPNPHNPGGVISDVINKEWLQEVALRLRGETVRAVRSEVLQEFKNKS